jgi:nucleoside-diphosphate-sugar epimerase
MTACHPEERSRQVCALVTGGGGFLGRAIVERLLARGDQVRSFARGDYPELAQLGVEVLHGDLADAEAIGDACRGCEVVFHVAARAGVWGKYRDYHEPNVRGTENVIDACQVQGVSRLVFTSSPSVVFAGGDMENVDESVGYPARHHSHYSATKALAEQAVLAADGDHLRTLILRPHLIWGPRDNHIVPRLIARARAGQLRQIGDGTNKIDSTYIDNAADAHVLAADALEANPNAAGRAYFISNGEPLPVWELINRIIVAAGLPPVEHKISRRAARALGAVLEFAHSVFGIEAEPRLTRFVVDELTTSHWFDISASRRELGYEPRVSIAEGLRRLEQWFRETGGHQT